MSGHVYFIQSGDDGPIKIGTAKNVKKRLSQLQTSSAETLRLLAAVPGNVEIEKEFHARFAEHRLRGEWFKPAEEILAEINLAPKEPSPSCDAPVDWPPDLYPHIKAIQSICNLEYEGEAMILILARPTSIDLLRIDPDSNATKEYLRATWREIVERPAFLLEGPYGSQFADLAEKARRYGETHG